LVLEAAASGVVVELVFLEAAFLVTFIRFVGTLDFVVTELAVLDTVTVGAGSFSLRVAATDFRTVSTKAFEAAIVLFLIRSVRALSFTITVLLLFDTITVRAFEFTLLATTFLIVVEGKLLETTVLVTFIGSILALSFTITSFFTIDALTIGAGPLRVEAATFLIVVEWEVLEAALAFSSCNFSTLISVRILKVSDSEV
jgi:hypothetical protein